MNIEIHDTALEARIQKQIQATGEESANREIADRIESTLIKKIVYLAGNSGGGHWRKDLTDER